MSLTTLLLAVLGTIVSVTDQSSFDRLQERVDSVLQTSTEELVVAFSPGVYFYREGQLQFSGLDRPELTVRFSGTGAVLVAAISAVGIGLIILLQPEAFSKMGRYYAEHIPELIIVSIVFILDVVWILFPRKENK